MFCAMKDGRAKKGILDPEERKKPCPARKVHPDFDPLRVFVDSPVYREQKVRDEDAYKGEAPEDIQPFGEVFREGKHFLEVVFEPECPFGEKKFTQEHPIFGDFGVKSGQRDVSELLVESPEYTNIEALNDPDGPRESFGPQDFAPAEGEEDP